MKGSGNWLTFEERVKFSAQAKALSATGMSQRTIAARLGFSRGTVERLLKGYHPRPKQQELPRPSSAVGVAPRDASHGLSSLELGAGPSKAPPPFPYAVYAARAWEFQRCKWDSGAFSRAIGALRFEDITESEIRALHRTRPIIASVPVSRHPPAAWVPREAMT